MHSRTHTCAVAPRPWRAVLQRHLTVLLAVKLAALALLWALFFSPAHRAATDSQTTARHLAVAPEAHADD